MKNFITGVLVVVTGLAVAMSILWLPLALLIGTVNAWLGFGFLIVGVFILAYFIGRDINQAAEQDKN